MQQLKQNAKTVAANGMSLVYALVTLKFTMRLTALSKMTAVKTATNSATSSHNLHTRQPTVMATAMVIPTLSKKSACFTPTHSIAKI
jgi:hypothetical protein